MIAILWSVLGVAMALSLPETPVRLDQGPVLQANGTLGLPGQRPLMAAPDPSRPPGY